MPSSPCQFLSPTSQRAVIAVPVVCLSPHVWYRGLEWDLVRTAKELYHRDRNVETKLASKNVLNPRHLGKGRDETSELEKSAPTEGSPGEG
jgi:(2Fe-2S) ferredoxin